MNDLLEELKSLAQHISDTVDTLEVNGFTDDELDEADWQTDIASEAVESMYSAHEALERLLGALGEQRQL